MYFQGVELNKLHSLCDQALANAIRLLKVEIVIGIGGYAEKRAQLVVQSSKLPVKVTINISLHMCPIETYRTWNHMFVFCYTYRFYVYLIQVHGLRIIKIGVKKQQRNWMSLDYLTVLPAKCIFVLQRIIKEGFPCFLVCMFSNF